MHVTVFTAARKTWVQFKLDPLRRPNSVRTRHQWSLRGGNTYSQVEPEIKVQEMFIQVEQDLEWQKQCQIPRGKGASINWTEDQRPAK